MTSLEREEVRKMKYLGSKVLETDRLLLRPTKEEDLKVIWSILCDKKVAEHYLVGKFNYDWEKEKVWQYKKLEKANNEDVFQWSIILKSENKCIGQASCQKVMMNLVMKIVII